MIQYSHAYFPPKLQRNFPATCYTLVYQNKAGGSIRNARNLPMLHALHIYTHHISPCFQPIYPLYLLSRGILFLFHRGTLQNETF